MSEEFGPDFITITDEETGEEFELELLGSFEYKGQSYAAFLPAEMEEEDEDYGIILMKVIEENGEELFSTLESDEELNEVYEYYMEELFSEDEDEE